MIVASRSKIVQTFFLRLFRCTRFYDALRHALMHSGFFPTSLARSVGKMSAATCYFEARIGSELRNYTRCCTAPRPACQWKIATLMYCSAQPTCHQVAVEDVRRLGARCPCQRADPPPCADGGPDSNVSSGSSSSRPARRFRKPCVGRALNDRMSDNV